MKAQWKSSTNKYMDDQHKESKGELTFRAHDFMFDPEDKRGMQSSPIEDCILNGREVIIRTKNSEYIFETEKALEHVPFQTKETNIRQIIDYLNTIKSRKFYCITDNPEKGPLDTVTFENEITRKEALSLIENNKIKSEMGFKVIYIRDSTTEEEDIVKSFKLSEAGDILLDEIKAYDFKKHFNGKTEVSVKHFFKEMRKMRIAVY